jgi:hypothetical protein
MVAEAKLVTVGRFDMFLRPNSQIHVQRFNILLISSLFVILLGRRPLGRPRCRWEDISKDLLDIASCDGNWMEQPQDRVCWWAVMMMVMNSQIR